LEQAIRTFFRSRRHIASLTLYGIVLTDQAPVPVSSIPDYEQGGRMFFRTGSLWLGANRQAVAALRSHLAEFGMAATPKAEAAGCLSRQKRAHYHNQASRLQL
jgi:hypothetical protein